jgi:prepilin-type processing-associated H-X9-DG protein
MTHDERNSGRSPRNIAAVLLILAFVMLAIAFRDHINGGFHDRDWPTSARCATALHQIGIGIILYQSDHGQQYPDDFEQLYTYLNGKLHSSVFVCPNSTDTPATGATVAETARNLVAGEHCSYIYLGKGMSDKTPGEAVVAYDPPTDHDGRMVALFADGHAEFLTEAATKAVMGKLAAPTSRPVTWP